MQNLINSKSNCIIVLEAGEYFLASAVKLNSLKNVSIEGYGAKIITKFEQAHPYCYGAGFRFENCVDCEIYGMTFETQEPANTKARIVEKQDKLFDDRLVVELEDGITFEGDEIIMGIDTLNEDLSPNGHTLFVADTSAGYEYELVSENTLSIRIWRTIEDQLDNTSIGELVVLRHSTYDTPPFNFFGCRNILIEDVTVQSSAGIACGIYNRSENFTFRRFNVGSETGELAYSSNTDGIHIKGLKGKLILDDCHFYNMGDDALNMNQPAGTVSTVSGNSIVTTDIAPIAGDVVYAYDAETLQKTAEFTVESFMAGESDATMTVSGLEGEVKAGNKLAISSLFPTVEIKNCSVKNSRARGFLIQSSNVTVENCSFSGTSTAGLMLACDIARWNELGPVNNAVIRNNVFENCGTKYVVERAGGIVIGLNHANEAVEFEEKTVIHSNITISGNSFKNMQDSAIFADAVKGITIKDNTVTNCCYGTEDDRTEDYSKDVVLFNCEDVVTENNGDITITNK